MTAHANRFTMEEVRRFWDGAAHRYERDNERLGWVHAQRFREGVARLRLRPSMRLLDVWSRAGGAVAALRAAQPDLRLVGAEPSLELLARARRRYPEELFVQASLDELPFASGAFDAVLSLETLEHAPDPLLFLTEVRRVLVDGGALVMSLPPSSAERASALAGLLRLHHGEGPHRFLGPREVEEMLREARFDLAEHRGTLFVPLPWAPCEGLDGRLSAAFGGGPLAQLGLRQFYVCTASR